MGFDGCVVPEELRPYVDWVTGTAWPEGDPEGCFRLADACVVAARRFAGQTEASAALSTGEWWDGAAQQEFVAHVQQTVGGRQAELVKRLIDAAIALNGVGVAIQHAQRMITFIVILLLLTVPFLILQAPWALRAYLQVMRMTALQIGKTTVALMILFASFGAALDSVTQFTQIMGGRRDDIDRHQLLAAARDGAINGALTGLLAAGLGGLATPALRAGVTRAEAAFGEKMLAFLAQTAPGQALQYGVAGSATTAISLALDGRPLDWRLVLTGGTSAALGADGQNLATPRLTGSRSGQAGATGAGDAPGPPGGGGTWRPAPHDPFQGPPGHPGPGLTGPEAARSGFTPSDPARPDQARYDGAGSDLARYGLAGSDVAGPGPVTALAGVAPETGAPPGGPAALPGAHHTNTTETMRTTPDRAVEGGTVPITRAGDGRPDSTAPGGIRPDATASAAARTDGAARGDGAGRGDGAASGAARDGAGRVDGGVGGARSDIEALLNHTETAAHGPRQDAGPGSAEPPHTWGRDRAVDIAHALPPDGVPYGGRVIDMVLAGERAVHPATETWVRSVLEFRDGPTGLTARVDRVTLEAGQSGYYSSPPGFSVKVRLLDDAGRSSGGADLKVTEEGGRPVASVDWSLRGDRGVVEAFGARLDALLLGQGVETLRVYHVPGAAAHALGLSFADRSSLLETVSLFRAFEGHMSAAALADWRALQPRLTREAWERGAAPDVSDFGRLGEHGPPPDPAAWTGMGGKRILEHSTLNGVRRLSRDDPPGTPPSPTAPAPTAGMAPASRTAPVADAAPATGGAAVSGAAPHGRAHADGDLALLELRGELIGRRWAMAEEVSPADARAFGRMSWIVDPEDTGSFRSIRWDNPLQRLAEQIGIDRQRAPEGLLQAYQRAEAAGAMPGAAGDGRQLADTLRAHLGPEHRQPPGAWQTALSRHLDVELTHDRARALDHLQDLVGAVNPHPFLESMARRIGIRQPEFGYGRLLDTYLGAERAGLRPAEARTPHELVQTLNAYTGFHDGMNGPRVAAPGDWRIDVRPLHTLGEPLDPVAYLEAADPPSVSEEVRAEVGDQLGHWRMQEEKLLREQGVVTGWRKDRNLLFHGTRQPPEVIHAEGLIGSRSGIWAGQAIHTSRFLDTAMAYAGSPSGQRVYVIDAPGGYDFSRGGADREVIFPMGIDRRFIVGMWKINGEAPHELDAPWGRPGYDRSADIDGWYPNPYYDPA
ncbi:hypothetical protein ACIBLB_31220 [Streptosporangium canum]|uniref:WXG100-like domain-containing protein n=1 Tax=Streptosporangium canum TaxID=324952 RepID=UPI00378FB36A